ncbi:MAG: DUF1761 domain-containing protein [Actinobacteria bacterium HGW-Actinobacteria-4]|nr:MAG: DUF1761 domain-containing protein [Actinobacteria bacterium HGW-Actinobacteria-4]
MEITLSPLAVVVAAVSMFIIGGLWYSVLFAKPWQRAAGVSDEALSTGAARVFGGSFVLALVIAASLAAFIGEESVVFATTVGAISGVTFAAAFLVIVSLFERRSAALMLINGGYAAVSFTVMGLLIGLIQ